MEAQQVVADAMLLLAGRTGATYAARTRRVRPWMLVNTLAHGDGATLEQLRGRGAGADQDGLDATMSSLAAELLSLAPGPADLVRCQRRVLIPLELELLAGDVPAPTTFVQLATLVTSALGGHRVNRD